MEVVLAKTIHLHVVGPYRPTYSLCCSRIFINKVEMVNGYGNKNLQLNFILLTGFRRMKYYVLMYAL